MAYQVDKYNGTFLVSVADGTIDTSTDLRFVGKNYAGYGEVQNENFLHLLENFANATAPTKAITGQIWYDSDTKKIKFYDGTRFKIASGAEVSSSAPSGLASGDFWFNSSSQQLYTWAGTEFVLIGPAAAPEFGSSAAVGQVVQDVDSNSRTIIRLEVGSETVAIVSKDQFDLNSAFPYPGFDRIQKGITLVNTLNGSNGVTSTAHRFYGTAANSDRLSGALATDFVRKSEPTLPAGSKFIDSGFTLGDDNDLLVYIDTQDSLELDTNRDEDQVTIWQKTVGQPITFRVQTSETASRNVFKIRDTGMFPGDTGVIQLGSSSKKWSEIYADTVYSEIVGDITGNVIGNITGTVLADDETVAYNPSTKTFFGTIGSPSERSIVYGDLVGSVSGSATSANTLGIYLPSISSVPETVAIRDTSGRLVAAGFLGTATFADRIKIDDTAVDTDVTYRTAKTTATGNTIAARDSSGNISANLFNGTATAARYADLAEKYLADQEYSPGTVVMIGGEKEVTATTEVGDCAIGVVSTNPAFMMNKDLVGGTYIALKGRVPVKVIGAVVKGQRLIAAQGGCAVAETAHSSDVFAIALESNSDTAEKIIEAVVL